MRVSLPNYSIIRIKDVPNWDNKILKSFIDNKEVQKMVKTLSDKGAKVAATYNIDNKLPISANSISLYDESSNKIISNIIVSKDKKAFMFDVNV